jgi:GNAT superfamily N-acetyltransferase
MLYALKRHTEKMKDFPQGLHFRQAVAADIPRLRALIDISVRALQAGDYSSSQIEGALGSHLGVDTKLIEDGTYFVLEQTEDTPLIASGGWSRRKTLCGSDHGIRRDDSLLDPKTEAAKIRAFYVHPDWARKGIGTAILERCEDAARAEGFTRFEMGATLTGVPLYLRCGYIERERQDLPMVNGESLPIVRMVKADVSPENDGSAFRHG